MHLTITTGIIGFGLSGRYFFAPFIEEHKGFHLSAFVSTQEALVKKEYPGANVFQSVDQMIADDSIDLIIVASPNATHFSYAKKAIEAGKHVIVEKPFTITSNEAEELIQLAQKFRVVLAPFQNRRWDGDFKTLQEIIAQNKLGEVLEFESHFDRFRPLKDRAAWKNVPNPGSGVLYDLGPHLIDQALTLFGDPDYVYGRVQIQRASGKVDDNFEVQLYYPVCKVILKAGVFVKENGPRFIVHGRKGSFVKYGLDPQEGNLRAGMKPNNPMLGVEAEDLYGILNIEEDGEEIRHKVKTHDGSYIDYFTSVFEAILGDKELAVTAQQVKKNIRIIELAFASGKAMKALPFH